MSKEFNGSVIEKEIVNIHFTECFKRMDERKTIWRSVKPVKNATVEVTYFNGCKALRLFINNSTSPVKVLNPGETFISTEKSITSVEVFCEPEKCSCNTECCCSGKLKICAKHKKPCPKPKKLDYTLYLVLFLLLVIVIKPCNNRHRYPVCY